MSDIMINSDVENDTICDDHEDNEIQEFNEIQGDSQQIYNTVSLLHVCMHTWSVCIRMKKKPKLFNDVKTQVNIKPEVTLMILYDTGVQVTQVTRDIGI